MTTRKLIVGFLLGSAVSFTAVAADPAPSDADVTQHVREMEQHWAEGIKKQDAGAIANLLADDFTLIGPNGQLVTKQQFIDALKEGALKLDSADVGDLKIRAYGDTAVAVGKLSIKGTMGGNDISGDYAFTDTFVRHDAKWTEVASQVNRITQ